MENNVLKYKDFYGSVEYSSAKELFCGKITGIPESVTFEGESVSELKHAFYKAVDDYITACEQKGRDTKKSYKGTFNVRISPELHQNAANEAVRRNISLNAFVENSIFNELQAKINQLKSKKEKRIMFYTNIQERYTFTDEDKKECLKTLKQLITMAQKTRKQGLLALEGDIPDYENLFMRKAVQLLVDSTSVEEMHEILEKYIIFDDYSSKEILEMMIIKDGVCYIAEGENPRSILEKLLPFFGTKFIDETEEIYKSFISDEIERYYRDIKAGMKVYPKEANLLEEKFRHLDSEDIQMILKDTSDDDIIWSINGSSAQVTDKLLSSMPKKAADQIVRTIIFSGANWKKYNTLESIIAAQERLSARIDERNPKNESEFSDIQFPGLEISMKRYELKINGKITEIPVKELEILYFLALNANRVFNRDEILNRVYGYDYAGESREIDVQIKRLREKLDGVSDKWKITTVWGVGYKFEVIQQ
jgi:predicted HicB family RNase H-like nuclease